MKNKLKVQFDSGRRVGRNEVLGALKAAISSDVFLGRVRECCDGHYWDDVVKRVTERLEKIDG
jgi:hypothetical protein